MNKVESGFAEFAEWQNFFKRKNFGNSENPANPDSAFANPDYRFPDNFFNSKSAFKYSIIAAR